MSRSGADEVDAVADDYALPRNAAINMLVKRESKRFESPPSDLPTQPFGLIPEYSGKNRPSPSGRR